MTGQILDRTLHQREQRKRAGCPLAQAAPPTALAAAGLPRDDMVMTGSLESYREYAPRAALRDFVHCVWTFAGAGDDAAQPIVPDGRPELIVHLRDPYQEQGAAAPQPLTVFAGQLTKPLVLVSRGEVSFIGVRFRPDGARAFLGAAVDMATDRRLDLVVQHGAAATKLSEMVRGMNDLRGAADAVEDYVEARIAGARIDTLVRNAVTRLLDGKPAGANIELSERQFQRRFKAEVGVSLRLFRSILRFRSVFDAVEHPQDANWVTTALAAGYFDQPQMARDFRRFLGCTAREWITRRDGLAQALTQ